MVTNIGKNTKLVKNTGKTLTHKKVTPIMNNSSNESNVKLTNNKKVKLKNVNQNKDYKILIFHLNYTQNSILGSRNNF